MYPVQFCLQPDDTFVVQNLGTQDPANDANVVQICPLDGAVYLHTERNAAIRGCNTVRLQIAVTPPPAYVPPAGCPSTSIQIPDNQEFRIRSTLFPDRWVFSQTQGTTTDIADAWIFTVTAGETGQISTVSRSDGRLYDSQLVPYLSNNNGYSTFYRNADITTQGWAPL